VTPLDTLGEKSMSKTKTFLSRWGWVTVMATLLLLVSLVLVGCAGGEPTAAPTEPPEPTEVAAEPAAPTSAPTEPPAPTEPSPTEEPTEPPPTEEPTEPPPTATPTEEPTPEMIDDSGCITCHTDEETLQALAVEPEAPEVESEGEG